MNTPRGDLSITAGISASFIADVLEAIACQGSPEQNSVLRSQVVANEATNIREGGQHDIMNIMTTFPACYDARQNRSAFGFTADFALTK